MVGEVDVSDTKNYADENDIKINSKTTGGKRVKTNESFRKTGASNVLLALSGNLASQNINSASTEEFNLFTHQQLRQKEGTSALIMDYANLKEAILELYLSVKIRSDDEIDAYNKKQFEKEKK